jgi:hypothetical protein
LGTHEAVFFFSQGVHEGAQRCDIGGGGGGCGLRSCRRAACCFLLSLLRHWNWKHAAASKSEQRDIGSSSSSGRTIIRVFKPSTVIHSSSSLASSTSAPLGWTTPGRAKRRWGIKTKRGAGPDPRRSEAGWRSTGENRSFFHGFLIFAFTLDFRDVHEPVWVSHVGVQPIGPGFRPLVVEVLLCIHYAFSLRTQKGKKRVEECGLHVRSRHRTFEIRKTPLTFCDCGSRGSPQAWVHGYLKRRDRGKFRFGDRGEVGSRSGLRCFLHGVGACRAGKVSDAPSIFGGASCCRIRCG